MTFKNALQYFHFLMSEGYSWSNARACSLMRFCQTKEDFYRRMNRGR